MNISSIFTKEYLLDPTPNADSGFTLYFLIFFSLLVVLSIIIKYLSKIEMEIKRKQFFFYLITGVLGLIYVFARYESLPWLASRLYLLAVFMTFIVWLGVVIYQTSLHLINRKNIDLINKEYKKYLPKN